MSTLHHVIDLGWLKEAYRLTRKDGAPGIDGVTAADYAANLEANLLDLLERIKSGRYQAPPVRRAYIPKADGSRRPLGIPTFEDKVALTAARPPVRRPCYAAGRGHGTALGSLQLGAAGRMLIAIRTEA